MNVKKDVDITAIFNIEEITSDIVSLFEPVMDPIITSSILPIGKKSPFDHPSMALTHLCNNVGDSIAHQIDAYRRLDHLEAMRYLSQKSGLKNLAYLEKWEQYFGYQFYRRLGHVLTLS